MPLTLTGILYNIRQSGYTDKKTGEVTQNFTAEILHTTGGRSKVDECKLEPSTVSEWHKLKGKEISIEVRPWAVPTQDKGIMQGFALANKTQLPNLIRS